MKETDLPEIIEGIKVLEKLSQGHMNHWRYVLENACSIWLMSPFKVGDRVTLSMTPKITTEERWGWMGSKHYLIKGSIASIRERSFYGGKFIYGVTFDDESYKDLDGILHPAEEKHIYSFAAEWLSKFDYDQLPCEAL